MKRRDFLAGVIAFLVWPFRPSAVKVPRVQEMSSEMTDLVKATLADLGKPTFADIAMDLQKHKAMFKVLRGNLDVMGGLSPRKDNA